MSDVWLAVFWVAVIVWAYVLLKYKGGVMGWLPWIAVAIPGVAVFGSIFHRLHL